MTALNITPILCPIAVPRSLTLLICYRVCLTTNKSPIVVEGELFHLLCKIRRLHSLHSRLQLAIQVPQIPLLFCPRTLPYRPLDLGILVGLQQRSLPASFLRRTKGELHKHSVSSFLLVTGLSSQSAFTNFNSLLTCTVYM